MKLVYLDTSSGISGDMFLGAFIDAGFKLSDLKHELSKLKLKDYRIFTKKVERQHITATKLYIETSRNIKPLKPNTIEKIIRTSRLDKTIKEMAIKVFKRLCQAEEEVHKKGQEVHLHELGHLDTILDIVGACVCAVKWGVEKIYYSRITFGRGISKGNTILPIPAPASLVLLKNIPARFSSIESELVTPTGAAILNTLGTFCSEPVFKVEKIGYGAGQRELKELPNALRLMIGKEEPAYLKDSVTILESAIDDTAPIVYTYLYASLFKLGVLDVYLTNIQMKKNRPAQLLTVILPHHLLGQVAELIFRETGTIGLRHYRVDRLKLDRVSRDVMTKYGKVNVKVSGTEKNIYKVSPEFESCREVASNKRVPFKKVYEEAKKVLMAMVFFVLCSVGVSFSDTVYLKDGSEVKGIVVEEYKDRVIMSTEHGETEIDKEEVKKINYDLIEQNLVAMADEFAAIGDYEKAYYYYEKARKANPNYKEAVEGANYLSGFLFRKELTKKATQVQWRQDVEDFQQSKPQEIETTVAKLKRLIGIELEERDGKDIIVKEVYSGMPADVGGVKKGDIISSVWGKLTKYIESEDVAVELTKPEHLEIKMNIDREVGVKANTVKPSQLKLEFEGLTFVNISERNASYDQGLRNRDLVLSIGGKSIRYTPLKEVQKMLKSRSQKIGIRREITIWRKKEG